MATEIYKGVYVPDHLSTDKFLKTRAYGYLSLYSDVRFKNWQTALTVATEQYKLSMDSYKAELKALGDAEDRALKTVTDLKREAARISSDYLTTEEKEVQQIASAKTAADAAYVGDTNAMRRTVYGAMVSANKTEFEASEAANRQSAAATINPLTYLPSNFKAEDAQALVQETMVGPGTPEQKLARLHADEDYQTAVVGLSPEIKARYDAVALKMSGATPAQLAAAKASDPNNAAAYGGALTLGATKAGTMEVPGSPSVAKANPTEPDYGAQQLSRLRQLVKLGGYAAIVDLVPKDADPKEVMRDLGLELSASDIENAQQAVADLRAGKARKPMPSLVEDARAIYSANYEQNPYAARLNANVGAAQSIGQHFLDTRLKGLPADADEATIAAAKAAALDDTYSWITGGYRVPAVEKASTKAGSTIGSSIPGGGASLRDQALLGGLSAGIDARGMPVLAATDRSSPLEVKADGRNAPFDRAPDLLDLIMQRQSGGAPVAPAVPAPVAPAVPAPTASATAGVAPTYQAGINGLPSSDTLGALRARGSVETVPVRKPSVGPVNGSVLSDRGEAVPVTVPVTKNPPVRDLQPLRAGTDRSMPGAVAPMFGIDTVDTKTGAVPSAANLKAPSTTKPGVSLSDRPGETSDESFGVPTRVPAAQATKAATQTKATIDIFMPDDELYGYSYDGSRDVFTVISGPKNVGATFPRSHPAYAVLMKDGYTLKEATERTAGAPAETVTIKQTAAQTEAQRRAEQLSVGMELAAKPDKLRRLLNNTPAGRLVNELYNANRVASSPQTFLQLREHIESKYKGRPEQMAQAITILAAVFLVDANAAERNAPTPTL